MGGLLELPATAHALSVAGAAFDVSIVPLLLWRRTRFVAWLALVAFHVSTWILFPIGVFPWLMIGVSTVFFAPDWPDHLRPRWNGWAAPVARSNHAAPLTPADFDKSTELLKKYGGLVETPDMSDLIWK